MANLPGDSFLPQSWRAARQKKMSMWPSGKKCLNRANRPRPTGIHATTFSIFPILSVFTVTPLAV